MTCGEMISLCISGIALLLTVFQFVREAWRNREKYELIVDNMQFFEQKDNNSVILNVTIINGSSRPLNITRFYLLDGDKKTLCCLSKKWCGEHYYPQFPETDIPRTERVFSSDFPLSISPRGAVSAVVKFVIDKNTTLSDDSKTIRLQTITNSKEKIIDYKVNDKKTDLTYL